MRWKWCVAAMLTTASVASAQRQGNQLAALNAVLDSQTRLAVLAIVDSARVEQLPSDVLINKALEGAGKRASGPRIIAAVRALAGELRESRDALGRASAPDEITAGAHALHAGVAATDLTRLRHAAVGRRLTTPLTVLSDLISRGVPPPAATSAVITLVRAGLRDADFATFQRRVGQDIENGADPATATRTRVRGATVGHRGGRLLDVPPVLTGR